ncbi:MAG: gamma-glutamyltransferase [Alphaproteobacteria bacterium RIFCSPLOWO2_01_FULL_40_26]|nr:MAG: gamma-glutamyltransferase [Alphaproteobacteria bacterium RIFCSPHIGHO2_02_FULL_40_34]OFW88417.1 MAG: gamma-glutamyltransferase [Alphaproteobacteria bacterium RIFCSPHIGHO2_01_FULL_40_8]OFW94371.1 MAG: gamma-glutamyltransferase [Alphaproteobacteria bacterium RIFCSPLOWO2_01_FULL_40_26]OFX09481.1 MAG: gamma-glutamyltransferase [Alphaproteobacteria bacterium RIFCSPLOWO2_02_FULL_40_19]OFX12120.1 MAG: gamma-glutamyltransferase [Alphaproteobacteria bacterium RIFCSPLOWO2_12_FULL_40_11]
MKKIIIIFALGLVLSACQNSLKEFLENAWRGEKFSGFDDYKVVSAKNYMISTSEKLASEAGVEILAKGGSVVDAAIAAQMVLNVVEPQSSGIGGGLFLLYYDAKNKKSVYFNGREKAPKKAFSEMFLDQNGVARDFYDVVGGGLSVGTPGALKALKAAHEKYGKLPWKNLFAPAIKIAREGFILDKKIHVILEQTPYLSRFDSMKIYFDANGKPRKIGTKIQNLKLAQTFEIIAGKGIKPFYEGKIANDIVQAVQNSKINPGYLALEDLKNYRIKQGNLLCGSYRIYKICSMPLPSSGGVTILEILGILENFDLAKLQPSSREAIHLISEATRLAYADRNKYVADVPNVPIAQMLDKKYLKSRAALIDMNKAMTEVKAGDFTKTDILLNSTMEKPSTTHVSIIDKSGNAVSMTSSIEYLFGSVLMVDGFMLNNQLTDFSLIPEIDGKKIANRVEPEKQPRSSMSPTFVFDQKNNLIMTIGSPGGPRIIQYVVKTIIGNLDWNLDIQQAISLPNHVVLNDKIELENRTKITKLKSNLEKMGHKVAITDITSGLHGITISNDGLKGGADPRRHGVATGK